jgi:hypothetical protein
MADDDYHVALRRFLGLVDPHLPPIHRQVDPKAGLTLAEAVLHFASEDDAERHRRLALEWGDPPDTLDGVEGLTWRLRRTDLHALECRLKSDRLAQLASGELVATALDLGEGIHAPRTRVPADLWRILKLDFANNTAGAHGRQLADVRVFRAEDAPADGGHAGEASRRPYRYSLEALRGWYRLRRAAWPPNTPFPSEAEDWADAKADFGDVPRAAIRAVRRDLAHQDWLKPGRRRAK